ncbi:hypothetical protein GCM10009850_105220 [Nonomuraea monospora]|uniref:Uncharacterized protein n=1 Tax=Nonomuraea monospora TaxID=568818 RepID=A0ABN3D0F2_9ACTN
MPAHSRITRPAIVALLAVTLAGCGAGAGTSAGGPPPAAERFDPPMKFETDGAEVEAMNTGVPAVWERYAFRLVNQRTGDSEYTSDLTATDLLTGDRLWSVTERRSVPNQAAVPVVASLGGRPLVLTAQSTEIKGEGTAPVTMAVDLLAADAVTGVTVWQARLPLGKQGEGPWEEARLVGADDDAIVIALGEGDAMYRAQLTMVVDPVTRQVRWTERLQPDGYAGGRVFGLPTADVVPGNLQSWDVKEHRKLWEAQLDAPAGSSAIAAGPTLILSYTGVPSLDGSSLRLLDAATGEIHTRLADGDRASGTACRYDEVSVVVCQTYDDQNRPGLVAYDAPSREQLWKLPENGRTGAVMAGLWHGALYGTTANGPLVLDARTGEDRETAPGAAPDIVTPYGGLVKAAGGGSWLLHRATG